MTPSYDSLHCLQSKVYNVYKQSSLNEPSMMTLVIAPVLKRHGNAERRDPMYY